MRLETLYKTVFEEMVRCRMCGRRVDDSNKYCPICASRLLRPKPKPEPKPEPQVIDLPASSIGPQDMRGAPDWQQILDNYGFKQTNSTQGSSGISQLNRILYTFQRHISGIGPAIMLEVQISTEMGFLDWWELWVNGVHKTTGKDAIGLDKELKHWIPVQQTPNPMLAKMAAKFRKP